MSAAKDVVRRFVAAINAGDDAALDRLVAVGYRQHDATIPDGRDALKRYIGDLRRRWPGVRVEVEQLIAEGDRVAAFSTIRGGGVAVRAANVWLVRDGMLAEHWEIAQEGGALDALTDVREGGPRG